MFTYSSDYFDYSAHFDGIVLDVAPRLIVPVLGFEQGKDGAPIAFLNPAQADAWAALTAEHVDGLPADQARAVVDREGPVSWFGTAPEPFTDAAGVSHFALVVEFAPNTDAASWSPVRIGL